MAATGFTPIQLYRTATASATPSAGNLADGELAINTNDGKLFFKNSSGAVTEIASTGGNTGTVSSVGGTGTVNGISLSGTVTTSGNLTLGGTLSGVNLASQVTGILPVANGGTGSSTGVYLPLAGGAMTGAITTNSTFDGRDVAADGVTADAALPRAGGTMTGNIVSGDNVKATYGTGADLEIYHDGSNSYIKDTGTGALVLNTSQLYINNPASNEFLLTATENGSVTLYYDNAAKIATTATGVNVTGTATTDGLTVDGAAVGPIVALTDAASITTNLALGNNYSVTLAGNRTLANPSNITAGQSGSIFITQDGTGSRTLAYGSYFKFVGGTAPVLSTTASAIDRLDYVVKSSTAIQAVASLDVK